MDSWTLSETIMLISLYKQRPCLYDPKNKNYSSKDIRYHEFECLRLHLEKVKPGVTIPCIQSKVRTLVDQLSQERLQVRKFEGIGIAYEPKLWCYKELEFLDSVHIDNELASKAESANVAKTFNCESVVDKLASQSDCMLIDEPSSSPAMEKENNSKETLKIVNGLRKEAKATVEAAKSLLQNRQPLTKEQAFGKLVALELKDLKFKESYDTAVKDILQIMSEIKSRDRQLYYEAVVKSTSAPFSK